MTEQKGNTGLDLLPLMKESNFGLISTYGHYEDWQPVSIVYPEKESRFIKKGKT